MTDEVVKFIDKYGDKIASSYEVLKEQSKWHDAMSIGLLFRQLFWLLA